MSYAKTVKIKDGDDFRVINESDFNQNLHELSEGETLSTGPITLNLKVGITPELQKVIDQAKAECEKVVAENEVLGQKISVLDAALVVANDRIAELEAKPKKPTVAELKTTKAAEQPQE